MLYRTGTTSPVFSLRQEIDRLFEDTLGSYGGNRGWVPAVDVRENEREYTFEMELPGIAPEQVDVTADGGVLTVRGEKGMRTPREGEQGRVHFVERSYGAFVRAFQLPQGVDDDAITAEFDHGLLTVHVPKARRAQPKKITIGRGSGHVGGGRSEERVTGGAQQRVAGGGANATPEGGTAERGEPAREGADREGNDRAANNREGANREGGTRRGATTGTSR